MSSLSVASPSMMRMEGTMELLVLLSTTTGAKRLVESDSTEETLSWVGCVCGSTPSINVNVSLLADFDVLFSLSAIFSSKRP